MYKINLYSEEINKINNLDVFKTTKRALMSIYCYFLKLGADKEEGLKISFDNIFNRYKRWHIFTKTKANFVKLSYKLIDLGLLTVNKIGNKNIYFARLESNENINSSIDNPNNDFFIDNRVNIEVNKEVNIKKPLLHSMDTNLEDNTVDTQIINTKTKDYYIIKDTESDTQLSNYEKAIIENNKERLDDVGACSLGIELLDKKNIRIEKIRNKVIDTLLKMDNIIVKKNAKSYIEIMIENACIWYENKRIAYATKVKLNKSRISSTSSFSFFAREEDSRSIEEIF